LIGIVFSLPFSITSTLGAEFEAELCRSKEDEGGQHVYCDDFSFDECFDECFDAALETRTNRLRVSYN
jgi:hypothetical protein